MLRFRRAPRSEFFVGLTPAWFAVTALFVAAILTSYVLNRFGGLDIVTCPMTWAFGISCPLCGGTRASAALALRDFAAAWHFNPLATIAVPAAILYLAVRLGLGIAVETTLPPWAVATGILALLAANWILLAAA